MRINPPIIETAIHDSTQLSIEIGSPLGIPALRYPEHLTVRYCTTLLEALLFAIRAVLREVGSNGDFIQISNVCTKYCVYAEYMSRDHDFPLMLPCPL